MQPTKLSWRDIRDKVLARDPVCRQCNNALATEVHHLDGNRRNNLPGNLLGLCEACHALEMWLEHDADGNPTDPTHAWNRENRW